MLGDLLAWWVTATLLGCHSTIDEPDSSDSAVHTGEKISPPLGSELVERSVSCGRDDRMEGRFERTEHFGAPAALARLWGAGLVVFDADSDDDLDILAVNEGALTLFRQESRGVLTTEPLLVDVSKAFGGAAADYDGDGDLDVYVSVYRGSDVLLNNDGHGRFTEVGGAVGLPENEARSTAVTWGDMDGDRDLDLFVGGYGVVDDLRVAPARDAGDPSFLFENQGGSLVDVSERVPAAAHVGYTLVAAFFDLNGDGFTDLYQVNDFGRRVVPNQAVFGHPGAPFTLSDDPALGVAFAGMGLGIGDVNADGQPDLAVSGWGSTALAVSSSTGAWYDSAMSLGLLGDLEREQVVGWSTQVGDVDNDGDADVAMAFGHLQTSETSNSTTQPDALFLQRHDGSFLDVGESWGVDDSSTQRGLVIADLDGDGWLERVRADARGMGMVDWSVCGARGWLGVQLRAPAPNVFAVGAIVELRAGERVWRTEVRGGGGGYASSGPPEVHVGLGGADQVDEMIISWPDGERDQFQKISARQRVTVSRTEAWR